MSTTLATSHGVVSLRTIDRNTKAHTDQIDTVHDMRFVIFDNSRVILASTFDADWDAYIEQALEALVDQAEEDARQEQLHVHHSGSGS